MVLLLLWSAWAAEPVEVRTIDHAGRTYRVVSIDLERADLDLYGQDPAGGAVRTFTELGAWLSTQGRRVVIGTNGGIFGTDDRPLGLHVERGTELRPVNTGTGSGNFYLQPNGVFWVDAAGAHVARTDGWPGTAEGVRLATQSGPLLLADGEVNAQFTPSSPNLLLRSGVGVSDAHTVHLAISEGYTRFYELATLFRDVLACRDALYLDGVISQLVDPEHPPGPLVDGRYASLLVVTTAD